MITEDLKQAIETWQKEDCKKRAIMVIAIEEKERTEDKTNCETSVCVKGSERMLVEAVKSAKKSDGVVTNIFNKANFMLLMEKLCK